MVNTKVPRWVRAGQAPGQKGQCSHMIPTHTEEWLEVGGQQSMECVCEYPKYAVQEIHRLTSGIFSTVVLVFLEIIFYWFYVLPFHERGFEYELWNLHHMFTRPLLPMICWVILYGFAFWMPTDVLIWVPMPNPPKGAFTTTNKLPEGVTTKQWYSGLGHGNHWPRSCVGFNHVW